MDQPAVEQDENTSEAKRGEGLKRKTTANSGRIQGAQVPEVWKSPLGFLIVGNSWRRGTGVFSDWRAGRQGVHQYRKLHLATFLSFKSKKIRTPAKEKRQAGRSWRRWWRFRIALECSGRRNGQSQATERVRDFGNLQASVFVCE